MKYVGSETTGTELNAAIGWGDGTPKLPGEASALTLESYDP